MDDAFREEWREEPAKVNGGSRWLKRMVNRQTFNKILCIILGCIFLSISITWIWFACISDANTLIVLLNIWGGAQLFIGSLIMLILGIVLNKKHFVG